MPLSEPQKVERADRIDEMRFNRMSHVAFRAGRTGEMVNLIDVIEELDGIGDVEIVVAEMLVGFEVFDVSIAAGNEIIDGDDVMAVTEKPVAKM